MSETPLIEGPIELVKNPVEYLTNASEKRQMRPSECSGITAILMGIAFHCFSQLVVEAANKAPMVKTKDYERTKLRSQSNAY